MSYLNNRFPPYMTHRGKPLPKWLTDAGCTFAINVDRQVKQAVAPLSTRTLPNGVKNDPYYKRVSDDVIITSGMVIAVANLSNMTIAIMTPAVIMPNVNETSFPTQNVSSNYGTPMTAPFDNSSNIGKYGFASASQFVYGFTLGTTLEQARALLAGTVIRYQLATPVDIVNSPLVNPLIDVVGKLGKNLFDPQATLRGYEFVSGLPSANALWFITAYIPVTPDKDYFKTNFGSTVVYYDSNFSMVSQAIHGGNITFKTPNNPAIKYMRLNGLLTNLNTAQLELGTVATAYEPYGFNNVLLQSFAGTTADGYTQIALPNGKNPWFLKFDGTDSLGIMANTADVDILGTNDFAISTVFRTSDTLNNGYIICKNGSTGSDQQYALQTLTDGRLIIYLATISIGISLTGSLLPNSVYELLVTRKSGILTTKLNKIETYNLANTTNLLTQPNLRIGARSSNVGGTTHASFSNINLGNLAIFYNGATGLDIAKVEKAVAKLNANYI